MAQERREIESALFHGKLWGVAATNALELGVDVGSLDATLHLGFPGPYATCTSAVWPLMPPVAALPTVIKRTTCTCSMRMLPPMRAAPALLWLGAKCSLTALAGDWCLKFAHSLRPWVWADSSPRCFHLHQR